MHYSSMIHVLFFLLLSLCFYLYFFSFSKHNPPKGFKIYPLLGTLPEFLKNRHRFLDWTTEILSRCPTHTAVIHRPGKIHGVITANPSNVEYILKTNFENYPKGDRFITIFQDVFGRGIFTSDGHVWKIQRKIVSHEFNTKSLRNFSMDSVKLEISTRLVPILTKASRTGQVLDLQDLLERFAFDNICKVAFNVDPFCLSEDDKCDQTQFMDAFEVAAKLSSERFMYVLPILLKLKKFFNMGTEKTLKKSIQIVHQYADEIIRSRMEQKNHNNDEDLLSRFIANDENSPEFLRGMVIGIILAGRDTTSSALSWFFRVLSLHPNVEAEIINELKAIRARNGKEIGDTYTFEELKDMNYLQAAISESMRLYPPVPVNTRACLSDDILPDGTKIQKGWFITYNTFAMGRMEDIWGDNCGEFVPERWLENGFYFRQESPFKYPVFHGGPRSCLGKEMGYIQMKSIAASIIERFKIDVAGKEKCAEHLWSLTLRIKGGLQVRVKERL